MAEQVRNYKCPNCGGPLHYDGRIGKLVCDYCSSSFDVREIEEWYAQQAGKKDDAQQPGEEASSGKETQTEQRTAEKEEQTGRETESHSESSWDYSGMSQDWGEAAPHMRVYQCPSCGAELICDETTGATSCPYCGNPAIIPAQFEGILRPDYIIPFRKDKAAAVAGLKEHCKGKPFLPSHFRDEDQIGKIQGIYVPFWLFDGQAEGRIVCETTRVHVTRMGDEEITRTDFFHVEREGTMRFDKVPVDASSRMSDDWMDSIEPFNYEELEPFAEGYLAGYLADRYDVSARDSAARADQRCEQSLVSALRNSVQGYNSCRVQGQEVHLLRGKVHYALLPVWVLHTKWREKDYLFMMNGQTGRMIGNLPVSPAKFAGLFGILTAVMTAVLMLLSYCVTG